ncbi:S-layer homology domain-containing protein [Cyanobacterium stanieri LEGE 03274]|uniref:S-layer homology domain-containing protein n=1 Tax=Cyanobacterium stanieri LEGE 03274 TaxID=1828756 RepID=A0ABR9V4C6_9CHRO|nr:S-layer homology domain-containing protein [Cyanobacterium stanieri]MBE9222748.1 S-layer homology domain-containing protein [Cyanobacterium stanieri LEGE 03274]
MSPFNLYKTSSALLLSLTMGSTSLLPLTTTLVNPAPVMAQNNQFNDLSPNHWASEFIGALVQRGVIAGFPDGTFRPESPVTRAQFAAMVQSALPKDRIRGSINFNDVASNYWATGAINNAYQMGFLSGYPGNVFRPEQNIPREQVLVSLANGLNYSPRSSAANVLSFFNDANAISGFAQSPIAAATENQIVVNYPNTRQLNPTRNATRAEVAAFIYQALQSQGQVASLNSPYIVNQAPVATNNRITAGTQIPVTYEAEKILLTQNETVPLTLVVRQDIVNGSGQVLIPRNSEIMGELRPSGNGTQFFAQTLQLSNGRMYNIDASSQIITETESVSRGTDVGNLVKNAALGTAAAAAISGVTGDRTITTGELLIGTGAGVLATLIPQFLGRNRVDLLVIRPETNLNITFNRDFAIQ